MKYLKSKYISEREVMQLMKSWQQKAEVDRVTRRVDKILVAYRDQNFGIPVDLDAMARIIEKEMNVKISIDYHGLNPDMKSEALVSPLKDGKFNVRIRTNLSFLKKRFALGHEFGHILISPEYGGVDGFGNMLTSTGRWLEKLCDEISGSILCPYFAIDDFLEKEFQSLAYQPELFGKRRAEVLKLGEMARMFQVQPLTLYHRIKHRYSGAKIKVNTLSQILEIFSNPRLSSCEYKLK